MFRKRERIRILEEQIKRMKKDYDLLEKSIQKWEQENKSLREELDNEHLENYNNKKVFLKIHKMYQGSYSTITSLIQFRKDVKKEIDNALNID